MKLLGLLSLTILFFSLASQAQAPSPQKEKKPQNCSIENTTNLINRLVALVALQGADNAKITALVLRDNSTLDQLKKQFLSLIKDSRKTIRPLLDDIPKLLESQKGCYKDQLSSLPTVNPKDE